MSSEAIKLVQKSGITISKEKLLDLIRKSPSKMFSCSQPQNSKVAVVVIAI